MIETPIMLSGSLSNMSKFSFFLGLSLFCAAANAVGAQSKVVLATDPPPAAPKRVTTRSSGNAEVLYNEEKDESVARSKPARLFKNDSGWGSFSSSFVFKGKAVQKPENVSLSVFIAAKDRTYVDDLAFSVYADGRKLFDGVSKLNDARTNGTKVYSSVGIAIKLSDFEKLAKAEKAIFKVGPTSFELSTIDLSSIRDLLLIIKDAS